MTPLNILKLKELGKFITLCWLFLAGGHVFWTWLCWVLSVPRGY